MNTDVKDPKVKLNDSTLEDEGTGDKLFWGPHRSWVNKVFMLTVFALSVYKLGELSQAESTDVLACMRYALFVLSAIFYAVGLMLSEDQGRRFIWAMRLCFVLPIVLRVFFGELGL